MSSVAQHARRSLRAVATQWATRTSTRAMIIPGSHQESLKKKAQRDDFWGEEQDIDSRYALMEKVRLQAKKFEERYMKPGAAQGFKKPWTVDEALAKEVDPVAHKK